MSKQPKVDKDGRKKSKYDPLASVERKTSTIKTTRTKIVKKSLNVHLNDLCILLIRIRILFSSLTCCNYLITFFFHMPNLCSDLTDNQIENLPPGLFTNNTALTYL